MQASYSKGPEHKFTDFFLMTLKISECTISEIISMMHFWCVHLCFLILILYPAILLNLLLVLINFLFLVVTLASLIAQLVKNLPAMQESLVRFLGREDPLEKG